MSCHAFVPKFVPKRVMQSFRESHSSHIHTYIFATYITRVLFFGELNDHAFIPKHVCMYVCIVTDRPNPRN